eukprot:Protomagalhaensia_sp_Gyna_25__4339@NODE_396_length_3576_cov_6_851286_g305_i0_p1_GENE_NODE_396_length_3576_cov_6_851286_g305_i0NODE_396_length_3576_cov_6_851286_g305_i0_p1_ORF_typecomplete_len821_score148_015_nucleotid_C/PF02872_18/7_5e28Metallophos/PF00149_28/1_4e06PGA_cap/PF09587_10/0_0086Metallophos_2/PF12850_7/0_048Cas_Cmr3/PF09700_10/0_2_NODE_396_length_3576_cov_6_851286_g305_i0922554
MMARLGLVAGLAWLAEVSSLVEGGSVIQGDDPVIKLINEYISSDPVKFAVTPLHGQVSETLLGSEEIDGAVVYPSEIHSNGTFSFTTNSTLSIRFSSNSDSPVQLTTSWKLLVEGSSGWTAVLNSSLITVPPPNPFSVVPLTISFNPLINSQAVDSAFSSGPLPPMTLKFTQVGLEPERVIRLALSDNPVLEFHVLSLNDFHGHLGTDVHGLSQSKAMRLAALVTKKRREYAAFGDTVLLAAGDNVGASQFETACQNEAPALQFLNLLGLQLSALGNHEFDKGFGFYKQYIAPVVAFPYLGANVYYKGGGGKSPVEPSAILTLGHHSQNQIQLGVIGVSTADLPRFVAPFMVDALEFTDPVAALNREASRLQAQGVNVIIALVHQGALASTEQELEQRTEFARIIKEADPAIAAIITGHTHKIYSTDFSYGEGNRYHRPVLQSGCCGEYLGDLKLEVDPTSKQLISASAINYFVQDISLPLQDLSQLSHDEPHLTQIAALLSDSFEQAAAIGQEVLGELVMPLTHPSRDIETPLCNLVADALLETARLHGWEDVDFAIQNPGAVRANLEPEDGLITKRDIATVLSFSNSLVIVEMDPQEILTMLEEQWQEDGHLLRLCFADLMYWYDSKALSPRVEPASVMIRGQRMQLDRRYKAITNRFIASGGDKFSGASGPQLNTQITDDQALVEYVSRRSLVIPDLMERAIDSAHFEGYGVEFCWRLSTNEDPLPPGPLSATQMPCHKNELCADIMLRMRKPQSRHLTILGGTDRLVEIARVRPETDEWQGRVKAERPESLRLVLIMPAVFDANPLGHGIAAVKCD